VLPSKTHRESGPGPLDERADDGFSKLIVPTHNHVLAALPQSDANRLVSISKPIAFAAGEVVYDTGDVIDHIFFPISSVFSSVALLEDGSSVEISMTGLEGVVGLPALIGGRRSLHWTRVSVAGAALGVSAESVRQLFMKSEPIHDGILRAYRGLYTQICQRSVCNVRHTLLQRLCVWLLMTHDRVASDELPFTQEDIASRISVRRAGVSVAASMLQAMHAISYQRGRIVISDRAAIEASACECYRVMKEDYKGKRGGGTEKSRLIHWSTRTKNS